MIKLRNILTEITLGSVKPYATQCVWKDDFYLGQTYYESGFSAEGQPVTMTLSPIRTADGEREYIFVFTTQNRWGMQSYSHDSSVARGHVDYLRLIRTVGDALLDFCAQHAPDAIDVSGGDADVAAKQKKNRIYAAFLRDNATRLATAGYTSLMRGDSLWIVRKSTADATGVEDTPVKRW
jgi:hypothetical protein